MTTYTDLLAKKATLDRQAAELEKQLAQAKKAELASVISYIKNLMAEYNLTQADLEGRAKGGAGKEKGPLSERKVAPKFRDPETGATWSGRGLRPRWLSAALEAGRKAEDFAV